MKPEIFYSNGIKQWAPALWNELNSASDADRHRFLVAVIDYAIEVSNLADATLLKIVEAARNGFVPDPHLCVAGRQIADALREEYSRLGYLNEWDHCDPSMIQASRLKVAAEIVLSACIADSFDAVMKALHHGFTFARVGGPPDMIARVTEAARKAQKGTPDLI